MAELAFDPIGFAYTRLFIKLYNNPLMLDLPYKIDTGANNTTINRELLFNQNLFRLSSPRIHDIF